ncbi:2-dehydro-3-deoxygluconokinase [Clostridium ragsdalei P11]|uniref:2-dehydro-3-deoxygluconokinase n=1 Tax=Clostridium ragsdalei P11 TaxID=1353534 RepID=A0A1A6AQK8_9CLOT|nr:sugar kinase [Clostridium ragsdalei]OBR92342.1 2-dehydro-3-deoxygluconokinase [Clostridium ragsdalei P11]
MSKKVVTLGELLLRLSTQGCKRFCQANTFDAIYGGSEANVSVSLANFGVNSYFVSKLPNNPIGRSAEAFLKEYGVNTDYIKLGKGRMGIYFYEKGTSVRSSKVVYDRDNSAITKASVDEFEFDEILKDADWFHVSGITLALGENCIEICKKALKSAKKYNIPVSVDLNYRKQLWPFDKFENTMSEILKDADLCIGWLDSNKNKDFRYNTANFAQKDFDESKYIKIFKNMCKSYNLKYVVTTLRESYLADNNGLSAVAYDGNELYHSKKYNFNILDRVGAGDAFAAGLIYKLVSGSNYKDALEFAVAASVLKHSIEGDFNLVSEEEVKNLLSGNIYGSLQR